MFYFYNDFPYVKVHDDILEIACGTLSAHRIISFVVSGTVRDTLGQVIIERLHFTLDITARREYHVSLSMRKYTRITPWMITKTTHTYSIQAPVGSII